jgi:primary-amine oxidase
VQQCFTFARLSEHENLYAHPLVLSPFIFISAISLTRNRISYLLLMSILKRFCISVCSLSFSFSLSISCSNADFPPHYKSSAKGSALTVPNTAPPSLTEDSLAASGRERIPPPLKQFDFLPDLIKETDKSYKQRTDVKPLHIVQPEGVSFKMNGHELEWQNWKMHIGDYHYRLTGSLLFIGIFYSIYAA